MSTPAILRFVGPIVAALIAAFTPFAVFYWSHFRLRAKYLSVIELATKRLSFWEKFLKVAESAADPENGKYHSARERAYSAILGIAEYADRELQILSWDKTRIQQIRSKMPKSPLKFLLDVKPGPSLSAPDRFLWYYFIVLAWIYALVWLSIVLFFVFGPVVVIAFHTPHTPHQPTLKQYLGLFALMIFSFLAAFASSICRFDAEKLKYRRPDPPDPPILDRI